MSPPDKKPPEETISYLYAIYIFLRLMLLFPIAVVYICLGLVITVFYETLVIYNIIEALMEYFQINYLCDRYYFQHTGKSFYVILTGWAFCLGWYLFTSGLGLQYFVASTSIVTLLLLADNILLRYR